MKVFISWSGNKSKQVALALSGWIPDVIQDVECFMSDESVEAGTQWLQKINKELTGTSFGIVCVTADNQGAPWLNFEAGALAKSMNDEDGNRVVPLTFDFGPEGLNYPLRQFNAVSRGHDGMWKLMKSINASGTNMRSLEVLKRAFEMWWPKLNEEFDRIVTTSDVVVPPAVPKLEDLVQEVLEIVRGMSKRMAEASSIDDDSSAAMVQRFLTSTRETAFPGSLAFLGARGTVAEVSVRVAEENRRRNKEVARALAIGGNDLTSRLKDSESMSYEDLVRTAHLSDAPKDGFDHGLSKDVPSPNGSD